MSELCFFIGCVFLFAGLMIFLIECYGIYHFHYVLNRMHAAAMGDTLGLSSCMVGLILINGWNLTSVKMFLVVIFFWFASPVASHMLARLEATTNENLEEHCQIVKDLHALDEKKEEEA